MEMMRWHHEGDRHVQAPAKEFAQLEEVAQGIGVKELIGNVSRWHVEDAGDAGLQAVAWVEVRLSQELHARALIRTA